MVEQDSQVLTVATSLGQVIVLSVSALERLGVRTDTSGQTVDTGSSNEEQDKEEDGELRLVFSFYGFSMGRLPSCFLLKYLFVCIFSPHILLLSTVFFSGTGGVVEPPDPRRASLDGPGFLELCHRSYHLWYV